MNHTRPLRTAACLSAALFFALCLQHPALAQDADTSPDAPDTTDAQATEAVPPYVSDPYGFRQQAIVDRLCEVFEVEGEPEVPDGDNFLAFLPEGTVRVPLVNPGFEFTLNNGKKPGVDYWIIGPRIGQNCRINGGGEGAPSDPYQGWSASGGAGVESGRLGVWGISPDDCTGYILANGRNNTLFQVLPNALRPNTRYTLLVEVFARGDYEWANENEILMFATDGAGNAITPVDAQQFLQGAEDDTQFAVSAVTFNTGADQPISNLVIHIGMNSNRRIRFNFDNARLWTQPVGPAE